MLDLIYHHANGLPMGLTLLAIVALTADLFRGRALTKADDNA